MPDLVESMKKAAADAVNASQPTAIMVGTVIQEEPIRIQVDQKLILEKGQLFLSRNVTDYDTKVQVSWNTGSATAGGDSHSHPVSGEKEIKVLNHLKKGELVILIRQSGGQKFIVMDRVV